jgi:hypothetical protein
MRLNKLQWEDFKGDPLLESPFSAHTYWNIIYTYNIILLTKKKSKKVRFKLNVNVENKLL